MKKELNIFIASLAFLTRLPVSSLTDFSPESLNKSSKYFPLVGMLIGIIFIIIYNLSSLFFPTTISLIISMISVIILTGGLHEDGFSDVCDAFGSSNNKEKILDIMKDSRIGAFGVIGLFFILLIKYFCLIEISPKILGDVLITGTTLSRYCAVCAMSNYSYSRNNSLNSKSHYIAKKLTNTEFLISTLFLIIPFVLFNPICIIALPPVLILKELVMQYFSKKIDGYTGDCMGFLILFSEIVFFLSVLFIWKFI